MRRYSTLIALLMFVFSGPAHGTIVFDTEPNDSLGTAQDLDGFFSTTFDPNIEDATGLNISMLLPHVEVISPVDPFFSTDFFSFTAAVGDHLVLDVDCGFASSSLATCSSAIPVDTFITLYDPAGLPFISSNDTVVGLDIVSPMTDTGSAAIEMGAGLSADSFIDLLFVSGAIPVAGTWTVEIGSGPGPTPIPFAPASDYILNVSLTSGVLVPEPTTAVLLGCGLLGLAMRRTSMKTSNIL